MPPGLRFQRISIPCRRDRYTATDCADGGWATPEPPHRINQTFFEPILSRAAARHPNIRILNRTCIDSYTQEESGVTAQGVDLETGKALEIRADYLIGCDGGRSVVRRAIGANLVGDAVIQRVQSTYFLAPDLIDRIPGKQAWWTYLYHPNRAGSLAAIDGKESWLLHNYLLRSETGFEAVDRDGCLRLLLGVDADFEYEVLSDEGWIGRRLVDDRFRDRRVFICGDAAHLWVPYAGYGMNTGIADAMGLSWPLAARINGWGGEALLDAYEKERQPITEQVSRFAMSHAEKAIAERTSIPADFLEEGPAGDALRNMIGEEAYRLHIQQFACEGLDYGYFYEASPFILYDDQMPPAYTMHDYTPSTVPGCSLPNFVLADRRSLYDTLGDGFALLRFNPAIDASRLQQAAKRRGVPLVLLDVPPDVAPECYAHTLVLSRPDRHVGWRGDANPDEAEAMIDQLTGWAEVSHRP
ncbi:2-polyprenyl-6-methoxyphenol hydroxylase-like FAD-dependent oxidoreductase [Novosphingobium sp. SG751A]|uniref:FAD-dependent monooxygenase n=1 Tax=Novosphingobium sp. SG751A TaxID=2587000 RepID=UPI001553A64A|nr:FAD-dependent monooxygenase [Novosphingobium sp. SG751A]NOW48690.1 2-polyprenyl-6-methoxyphenol hydroxylase-like FAD-dependent oxidoreductase [Novosphingobium sp. SG751A]